MPRVDLVLIVDRLVCWLCPRVVPSSQTPSLKKASHVAIAPRPPCILLPPTKMGLPCGLGLKLPRFDAFLG